jgi:KaiC/GvpD/RAD55 family RecA-like ATPase
MNHLLQATLNGVLRRDLWEANRAAMGEDVLTNSQVRTLVKYIGELHERYERDLTTLDLERTILAKYPKPGGIRDELLDVVHELDRVDDQPFEEVQPLIADYLTRELAQKAMIYIGSRDESDIFDVQRPLDLLTLAAELASGVPLDVEDMSEAPAPSEDGERERVCTVGLGPLMDVHLNGGVADGEMLIWLAPPGVGKTSLLINQGVEMTKAGSNVLHITLEINKAKCRQRVDQALTGLTSAERIGKPKLVVAARKKLKGKYYIKDWCSRNTTVDDIRTLVRNMRAQGKEVDTVCVDYLELMAPTVVNRNGERFNFSMIAKEMRRLANELGVKLITAWQVNRVGADKHIIGKTDVSECWDIVKHADIIMGLNQNEKELAGAILRVNIIKQRESTARPLEYYHSDLDRMVIYELKEGDLDEPADEMGAGNGSGVRQYRCGAAAGL